MIVISRSVVESFKNYQGLLLERKMSLLDNHARKYYKKRLFPE